MSQNNPYDEVSQQVAHEMMPLKGDENPEVGFKSNSYDQYDTRNLDKVYFSRLKHIVRDPKSGELKGLEIRILALFYWRQTCLPLEYLFFKRNCLELFL